MIPARDKEELSKLVAKGEAYRPSRYEIRLDYTAKIQTRHYEMLKEIMGLGIAKKSIITIRASEQGGQYSGDDAEKISILEHVLNIGPWAIDLEYGFAKKNPEFVNVVQKTATRLLVSWHDFDGTPPIDSLLGIAGRMSMISNHIKVVTMAQGVQDLLTIEKLRKEAKDSGINITAFAMGPIGQTSRVSSALSGELAYTILPGKKVAAGQLDIESMNQLRTIKRLL